MFRPIIGAILATATILGGVVALLALLPRPLVSLSDPVDPRDAWTASLTVTNSNFIPLEDVGLQFGVGQLISRGFQPDEGFVPNFRSRILIGGWQHHTLEMDDRYEVALDDAVRSQSHDTGWADIAIIVTYRPWILPFHREKIFRFITRKRPDGRVYWFAFPVNEPPPSSYMAN